MLVEGEIFYKQKLIYIFFRVDNIVFETIRNELILRKGKGRTSLKN